MPIPKRRLFISHIAKETELAQALKNHLAKDFLGILDVFVSSDRKTIQAGAKWLEELSKALEEALIEIVLCSKESVGRPWVNFEAGAGWIRGIPVIPVCHSGMRPKDLPMPLNTLQAIEAGQGDGLRELYEAIAGVLEMQVPAAMFESISGEIRELEKKYQKAEQDLERIESPLILCAASEQYEKIGFDRDIAVLEKAFPQRVVIERNLTSRRLRDLLTSHKFAILHLVLAVDPDSGDLLFSSVDQVTHMPATAKVDKLSAEGFSDLVGETQARLVVLATCFALYLAVEIAHVANMVGTKDEITSEEAAEWSECFYDLLAKGYPLFKACDLAESNTRISFKLVRQKDLVFDLGPNTVSI